MFILLSTLWKHEIRNNYFLRCAIHWRYSTLRLFVTPLCCSLKIVLLSGKIEIKNAISIHPSRAPKKSTSRAPKVIKIVFRDFTSVPCKANPCNDPFKDKLLDWSCKFNPYEYKQSKSSELERRFAFLSYSVLTVF